jgi:hypothetical protein
VWLLGQFSSAYVSNQFRALQQFFKWLGAEEEIRGPMVRLRASHVAYLSRFQKLLEENRRLGKGGLRSWPPSPFERRRSQTAPFRPEDQQPTQRGPLRKGPRRTGRSVRGTQSIDSVVGSERIARSARLLRNVRSR